MIDKCRVLLVEDNPDDVSLAMQLKKATSSTGSVFVIAEALSISSAPERMPSKSTVAEVQSLDLNCPNLTADFAADQVGPAYEKHAGVMMTSPRRNACCSSHSASYFIVAVDFQQSSRRPAP